MGLRTSRSRRSHTSALSPTATSGALPVRPLSLLVVVVARLGKVADFFSTFADGNETSASYYMALTSTHTPSILACVPLSRRLVVVAVGRARR